MTARVRIFWASLLVKIKFAWVWRLAVLRRRLWDLSKRAYLPLPVSWVSRRGGRTRLGSKFPRVCVGIFWAHCHFAHPEKRQ